MRLDTRLLIPALPTPVTTRPAANMVKELPKPLERKIWLALQLRVCATGCLGAM